MVDAVPEPPRRFPPDSGDGSVRGVESYVTVQFHHDHSDDRRVIDLLEEIVRDQGELDLEGKDIDVMRSEIENGQITTEIAVLQPEE